MFITIPSLRMTHAPRSDYRGVGAGGRHKAALARLHSVGSLNRSHDCTAEGRGSSLAPTGRRSFDDFFLTLEAGSRAITALKKLFGQEGREYMWESHCLDRFETIDLATEFLYQTGVRAK